MSKKHYQVRMVTATLLFPQIFITNKFPMLPILVLQIIKVKKELPGARHHSMLDCLIKDNKLIANHVTFPVMYIMNCIFISGFSC